MPASAAANILLCLLGFIVVCCRLSGRIMIILGVLYQTREVNAHMMAACFSCPRQCGAQRAQQAGACGVGERIQVARAALHHWEEPCISGIQGSGTVFFTGCSLGCVFCQNHAISQQPLPEQYREVTWEGLARIFQRLEAAGAHNINLVNPTHMVPLILPVLLARPVAIPVVYNSGGYDAITALHTLEGLVDVYLPDMKYANDKLALTYSNAADYVTHNRAAVLEMVRQVGAPQFDAQGMMVRGVMIRHLVLPGMMENTLDVLSWIHDHLPGKVYVSLMAQYTPLFRAFEYPKIARTLTRREWERVLGHMEALGMVNGFVQEMSSADEGFVPMFGGFGVMDGDCL